MFSIFNGRERTLGGATSEVFAQVSVDFREYLHLFKGAKLNVFMAIALHANEDGWAWPGYAKLCQETGYNVDTIKKALSDLCDMTINGHRVLLRYQPTSDNGTFTSNHYLLFPSVDEATEYDGAGIQHLGNTGGGFDRGRENPPRSPWWEKPTTVNPTTNQNHIKPEPIGGDGSGSVDNSSLDVLLEIGVERTQARKLAATSAPDQVLGWCDYARDAPGLDSPAALVVARLREGDPAPARSVETPVSDGHCPVCHRVYHPGDICLDCGRCYHCCECVDKE